MARNAWFLAAAVEEGGIAAGAEALLQAVAAEGVGERERMAQVSALLERQLLPALRRVIKKFTRCVRASRTTMRQAAATLTRHAAPAHRTAGTSSGGSSGRRGGRPRPPAPPACSRCACRAVTRPPARAPRRRSAARCRARGRCCHSRCSPTAPRMQRCRRCWTSGRTARRAEAVSAHPAGAGWAQPLTRCSVCDWLRQARVRLAAWRAGACLCSSLCPLCTTSRCPLLPSRHLPHRPSRRPRRCCQSIASARDLAPGWRGAREAAGREQRAAAMQRRRPWQRTRRHTQRRCRQPRCHP